MYDIPELKIATISELLESFDVNQITDKKTKLSENDAKQRMLIALTRPIDTLVISIKDKNSKFSKMLKQISEKNEDFVKIVKSIS